MSAWMQRLMGGTDKDQIEADDEAEVQVLMDAWRAAEDKAKSLVGQIQAHVGTMKRDNGADARASTLYALVTAAIVMAWAENCVSAIRENGGIDANPLDQMWAKIKERVFNSENWR